MPDVRRSADRFLTEVDGISTRHSFSYGRHYDPDNIGFGALMAVNDETLAPGAGYPEHVHADVEIVTWVLEGTLAHRDATGQDGIVRPGTAQRLSAGEGVRHSERNASDTESLRFVQMMLRSHHESAPAYASVEVPRAPGRLAATVEVAAEATLFVAVFDGGERVEVPASPRLLVHVTRGSVVAGSDVLAEGDELRDARDAPLVLTATSPAEALVWLLSP